MNGFSSLLSSGSAARCQPAPLESETLEAQLAVVPDLKAAAYRIRYEAYNAQGYVSDRENLEFSDVYDTRPNCKTALVYKNGSPAATIRLAVYDPASDDPAFHHLQAMGIFGEEIRATVEALSSGGRKARAAEVGKLARLNAHARDVNLISGLFRTVGYLILQHDIDVVFNAVRAHHMPMYRRFGFQPLQAPRQYPGLTFQTALMACFRASYDEARTKLPFLQGLSTDDAAYAGLIAGKRVPIFAGGTVRPVRQPGPEALLSQRPDGLRNSA